MYEKKTPSLSEYSSDPSKWHHLDADQYRDMLNEALIRMQRAHDWSSKAMMVPGELIRAALNGD